MIENEYPFKKAFLDNNYTILIQLLENNIIPTNTELIYILSQNNYLADCLALRKIEELKFLYIVNE